MHPEGKGERTEITRFTAELKAASDGNADAQLELGQMYEDGIGIGKNMEHAVMWYRKAAEQENIAAYLKLADIYDDLLNKTEPNYEKILFHIGAALSRSKFDDTKKITIAFNNLAKNNPKLFDDLLSKEPLIKAEEIVQKKLSPEMQLEVRNRSVSITPDSGEINEESKLRRGGKV